MTRRYSSRIKISTRNKRTGISFWHHSGYHFQNLEMHRGREAELAFNPHSLHVLGSIQQRTQRLHFKTDECLAFDTLSGIINQLIYSEVSIQIMFLYFGSFRIFTKSRVTIFLYYEYLFNNLEGSASNVTVRLYQRD